MFDVLLYNYAVEVIIDGIIKFYQTPIFTVKVKAVCRNAGGLFAYRNYINAFFYILLAAFERNP